MPLSQTLHPWHSQLGSQRDWVWRGWQIRYTHLRPTTPIGDTTPIVFLHGFGAALTQWRHNLVPLSQENHVYALDLLGFGASEKASTRFNVNLWVEQVRDFCQTFVGRPVVLVGHSLGALVALTAAVNYPELVKDLVLITLPASRQELLPKWLQPIVQTIESVVGSLLIKPLFPLVSRPGFVRSALKKGVYTDLDYVTEELVMSFLVPIQDKGAARTLQKLTQSRTQTDFCLNTHDLLPQLQIPVLLLWGELDRVIPVQWGRELNDYYTHLKMVEISQAGHCPYDEAADQVNREILTWIRSEEKA